MTDKPNGPEKELNPPTADREIPRGTDEHADSTEKRGAGRSSAAPRRAETRSDNEPADEG